jgi:HlyD family secretion protein
VSIDETEISNIAEGQKVLVTLDAFPDQQFEGRVGRVALVGTTSQGIANYGVRVDLSPSDLPLRPLMTAAIDIVVNRKDNVIVVPNRALKRDAQGIYVDVLRGGLTQRVYVTTGIANEDLTEILKGLNEGDQVVVAAPRANVFGAGMGG